MEIVLISDGSLSIDSPVRKLPFFFAARLIDMSKVSPRTIGNAQIAIVELLEASDEGLTALKTSWGSMAEIPVICLVDKKNRREAIQAAALGKSEIMQRDTPFAILLRRIRSLTFADPASNLPGKFPVKTVEAFRNSNAFLESLCFSAVEGSKIQVNLLNECTRELLSLLSLDGLFSWLDVVGHHHSATSRHSLMVAGLAGKFAMQLGWSGADCRQVIAGGLIHDIGKMRIPLSILDKAEGLTDEERALIDRHPKFGRDILKPQLEIPIDIKKMAIQHHEYLDGSGYPDGLKGSRISPKVRLITICEIFATLTENSSYKEALSSKGVIATMREMGPKLDQKMLLQFAQMILESGLGEANRVSVAAKGGATA
jgi:putative nucleotidyltransferase with HDIG domain